MNGPRLFVFGAIAFAASMSASYAGPCSDQIDNMQARIDAHEHSISELEVALTSAQKRAAEAIVRVAELEQEIDVLRAELDAWLSAGARRHA